MVASRISELKMNTTCETCSNAAFLQLLTDGSESRLCSYCYNIQIKKDGEQTSLKTTPLTSDLFVRDIHLPVGWRSVVEDELGHLQNKLIKKGGDLSCVQISNIRPGERALEVEFLRDAAGQLTQEFRDRLWSETERKCMRCGHTGEKCRGAAYGRHLCVYCASLPRMSGDYG